MTHHYYHFFTFTFNFRNAAFSGIFTQPEKYLGARETMSIVAARGEPYTGFGLPDDGMPRHHTHAHA